MSKRQVEEVSSSAAQSIEELQRRYRDLDKRKTQAETNLENATQHLERLKKEAREKYETDDLDELREKLKKMTEENEKKRSKYQAELDGIESDLAAVEREFAVPDDAATEAENKS